MTYRDDEHAPLPDPTNPPQAMIGGPRRPGDALVAHTNGALPAAAHLSAPLPPTHDVLRGGMDANNFLHSLRRRWLLALGMGLVVGSLLALLLWVLFPESRSAVALFQVASQMPTVFSDINRNNEQNFDILKKTHLALLKSHFVLQYAVRLPGVSSLGVFAGQGDQVIWLQENLSADFPQQGEILSISLTSDATAEDLRLLVDAVATAYEEEVIYREKSGSLVTRDALAKSYARLDADLSRSMENYYDLLKDQGISDGTGRDPGTDLLLSEIRALHNSKSDIERQLMATRTEFLVYRQRLSDPQLIEQQVDAYVAQDPQLAILNQELMRYHYQLAQLTATVKRGQSRGTAQLERTINELTQKINQHRGEIKRQMLAGQKNAPNHMLQSLNKEFGTRIQAAQAQLRGTEAELESKMALLSTKIEGSVDLEKRKAELDRLKEIAKDMSIKLESLEVEKEAPNRVVKIQPAVVTPGINTAARYMIASLGGLGGLALTCFAIGYLEFRGRRLNGPEQVDEGLGIRVVGALPALSARKLVDPNHPIVAQLTESIDSIRTILMHDASGKRRQVVLVTSAATMEGRTTVASQLAASLARAGRRTLLIDGDLRRPALHSLFDLPLEDGVSEVLRTEVDVDDAIRPTHAEGLWLLTAGYCDVDAIHALATEQLQPVFDKLRTEYDFIIIDGAPVVGMSDALIFGQYSDGAIISVRRDFSQMPKIYQAAELLRGVGIRVIGAVVNGVSAKADDRVTQLRLISPKSEREQLQPTG